MYLYVIQCNIRTDFQNRYSITKWSCSSSSCWFCRGQWLMHCVEAIHSYYLHSCVAWLHIKQLQITCSACYSGLLCLSQQCQDDIYIPMVWIVYLACARILPVFLDTPSGYFTQANSAEKVYCDMENKYCNGQGLSRVAYVNMLKLSW